ncbi:hypothetical protein GA707_16815 [Nostocoides sp. F2B08]|uniref:hypothetical protein n=1 Tax=Nostocoides sp. F2B08 TaxID=2653936 RepID=UPI00126308A4|nr:hypothetical protein [Tetrasphaera sp. F2B08]KAB7741875.1 hypothetical protein GA707_16815 [Tetrasphaera sp. F2B08]
MPTVGSAEAAHAGRVERLLGVGFLVGVPILLAVVLIQPVRDPDTYFHILGGRHLLQTGSFAGSETFSRYATEPWVLHEWFGQVLLFGAYAVFDYPGVAWLSGTFALILFCALFVSCRLHSRTVVALGASLIAFAAAAGSISPRPQVLSFVFLSITVASWDWASRQGKLPWWLVPMAWIWACSHGFWFLGPLVGFTVIAGTVCDQRKWTRQHTRMLMIPVAQFFASALTPLGLELFTVGAGMAPYTRYVTEWQRPELTEYSVLLVLASAGLVVAGWATKRLAFSWGDLLLMAGGVLSALVTARTIAVGAVLVAPLAAKAVQALAPRPATVSARWDLRWLLTGAAVGSLLLAFALPQTAARPAVPTGLSSSLASLPEGTGVINEYTLGGWLLLEHPNVEPVIDGRADVYAIQWFAAFMEANAGGEAWRGFVSRSGALRALVKDGDPLANLLKQEEGWCVVAADRGYVLLASPRLCNSDPQHQGTRPNG